MFSAQYHRMFQRITRKTNPLDMTQLSRRQMLETIIGGNADKLLDVVETTPQLLDLPPRELVVMLASVDGVGAATAIRYVTINLFCASQTTPQTSAQDISTQHNS